MTRRNARKRHQSRQRPSELTAAPSKLVDTPATIAKSWRPPAWLVYLALALALAVMVALVFAQALDFQFVLWDDDIHIQGNPWLRTPSWRSASEFLTKPYFGLYIPVPYLFWLGLTALGQVLGMPQNPALFHGANLLLHSLNGFLVLLLLRRFSKSWPAAWLGMVLFAFHPLQVEAVAWVSGAKDLLMTFFSLVTLLLALDLSLSPGWWRLGTATATYIFALCSKPSAVVVAPIAAILLAINQPPFGSRSEQRMILCLALWGLLALPIIFLTHKLQASDMAMLTPLAWIEHVTVAIDSLSFYISKLFWPVPLVVDYGRTPSVALADPHLSLALVLLLVAAAAWWSAVGRSFVLKLAVFLVGILPVSGIIPFAFQNISTVADRYMYFPMIGLALAWTHLLSSLRASLLWLILPGFLAVLSVASHRRTADFRSTEALFTQVLQHNDLSFSAHNNLGVVLIQSGQLRTALGHLERAMQLRPSSYKTIDNIGVAMQKLGYAEASVPYHQKAIGLEPSYGTAYANLGEALRQLQRPSEAKQVFLQGLLHDPKSVLLRINLGVLLEQQGEHAAAEEHYLLAERLDRDSFLAHYNLGVLYEKTFNFDKAALSYERALRLRPDSEAKAGLQRVRGRQTP